VSVPGTFRKARIWPGPVPGTHEAGFHEQPIEQIQLPEAVRRMTHGDLDLQLYAFRMGECGILLAREPAGINGEMRWHLTISCPDRHPSWDEIKVARYRLLGPSIAVAMVLPQPEFYTNLPAQDHVFQLYEIEDPARFWETG
jgi:hypothetical protein